MSQRMFLIVSLIVLSLLLSGNAYAQTQTPEQANWYARYWNNTTLSGIPAAARSEVAPDHDWGAGSPAPGVRSDEFSARWTSFVHFDAGTYRFTTTSDDGIRIWVEDEWIIESWMPQAEGQNIGIKTLEAGQHPVVVEYYENTGVAQISINWERIDETEAEGVNLTPTSGTPGSPVQIQATGLNPNQRYVVGLGVRNAEPAVEKTVETNVQGNLVTTMTIPASAEPGEMWVALVRDVDSFESTLSNTFTVTLQPGAVTATTEVNLNVRVGPGTSFSIIDTAPAGTTLEVFSRNQDSSWVQVTYQGQRGWMAASFTDITGQLADVPVAFGIVATTNANLQLRAGPGTGQAVLDVVPSGTAMEVVGRTADLNWIEVDYQGARGWLPTEFADINGELATVPVTTDLATTPPTGVVATTEANLSLRSGPSTGFQVLDVVPEGTTLSIIGRNEDGSWLQVEYLGRQGWMAAWLTSVSGQLADVPVTVPVS